MKMLIEKNVLMEGLNCVSKALSTRNIIPVLNGIKFELTKDKAIFVNSLQKVMSPTIGYFDKLNTAFIHI